MKIYLIRDIKVGRFQAIFQANSDEEALRTFNFMLAKNPFALDYQLFCSAEIDEESGFCHTKGAPAYMCNYNPEFMKAYAVGEMEDVEKDQA